MIGFVALLVLEFFTHQDFFYLAGFTLDGCTELLHG